MKILFIADNKGVDYQSDVVFHGLNCIPGIHVHTIKDLWYLFQNNSQKDILNLYGKGFSVTNRIPLEKKIIEEISIAKENILSHYYDLIIYGSIYRCDLLINEVLSTYKKEQIFFIDGEDEDFTKVIKRKIKIPFLSAKLRTKALQLSQKGIYFKRELRECDRRYFFPISFAIPEENIVKETPLKTKEVAFIIPGDTKTYIYNSEKDYYEGYAQAKYGITFKKAGWDCMRHYEILANACIPYFPRIEHCPKYTMTTFPKSLVIETNRLIDSKKLLDNDTLMKFYINIYLEYTRNMLTTKKLAEYILSFLSI